MMQISRVNRSKSDAKRAYDRLSRFYDLLTGSSETRLISMGLEMLAIKPGETILEIGCGTGKALELLCGRAGELGLVCGLDLSPGMLKVARSSLANEFHAKSAYLSCGDGADLPFISMSFDALFMSFTLELFDTPELLKVLAECLRVLKPGGRLGVVAMSKPGQTTWVIRLYEWFHAQFPAYVDCRPIHAEAIIQAAGFTIENWLTRSMWALPVELVLARKS